MPTGIFAQLSQIEWEYVLINFDLTNMHFIKFAHKHEAMFAYISATTTALHSIAGVPTYIKNVLIFE